MSGRKLKGVVLYLAEFQEAQGIDYYNTTPSLSLYLFYFYSFSYDTPDKPQDEVREF
jgi:hypothetical protein